MFQVVLPCKEEGLFILKENAKLLTAHLREMVLFGLDHQLLQHWVGVKLSEVVPQEFWYCSP